MSSSVLAREAVAHGIECPTCHTVYFLDAGRNSGRMCQCSSPTRTWAWKFLCICSQQISFGKADVARYGTTKIALERGYAIEGEWKRAKKTLWARTASQSNHSNDFTRIWCEALGLSIDEFRAIASAWPSPEKKEKGGIDPLFTSTLQ